MLHVLNGLAYDSDEAITSTAQAILTNLSLHWIDSVVGIQVCFAISSGVLPDPSLAADDDQRETDQGHASAQYSYGFRLANGSGVSSDNPLATHYSQLAADQCLTGSSHIMFRCSTLTKWIRVTALIA